MTREEAIDELSDLLTYYTAASLESLAIQMGIKALKVNEVHIVIIRDVYGNPQINCCFDNLKSANEYADYLHSQNIAWVDILSMDLYSGVQDVMEE